MTRPAAVGRIFCPHELKPILRPSSDFFALHNSAAFGGFSVNYVAYGGSVSIDPGCLERFFLLQIPLHGAARIETASRDIATAPDVSASLLSPTIPTRMTWQSNCAQIILLVDRRLLEQRAAALSGRPAGTVEFEPIGRSLLAMRSGASVAASGYSSILPNAWDRNGSFRRSRRPTCARLCLAVCFMASATARADAIEIFGGRAESLPRPLRRAREFLYAHADEPLDLAQTCRSRRHGNPRFAAWLPAAFRNIDLGDAARYPARTSQCQIDRRLPLTKASPISHSSLDLPISAEWQAPIAPNSVKRRRRRCAG